MKKFALFCAAAIILSAFSTGCSSDGSFSLCRSGSLFPTTRAKKEIVYTTSATGSQCDPCQPASACQPCEPACNPCEPACNPCDMNTGISARIIPGPAN